MAVDRLSIPSDEAQLIIIGPKNSFKASRVQRMNLNTDIPTTRVSEIGNSADAGTSKDVPTVTTTFSAFDTSIKIFSALTGTDPTAYPAAGVDISLLGEVDVLVYFKSATSSSIVKSLHAKRLQVRDFAFNYSVNGEATEDYTLIGSERRWFVNDVIVDRFTTAGTSFTLNYTPVQLKNGKYIVSAVQDGVYLTEVSGTPGAGEYSITGTAVTTGSAVANQIMFIYQTATDATWSDVTDATIPAAIRGKDVKLLLSANDIPRVQSVTINGSINPQPVSELGTRNVVGYQRQVPEITGTITVLDTDTQLVDLFTTGSLNSGDVEFAPGEGCTTSGISLKVELLDPCEDTAVVLKTVYIDVIETTGEAFSATVNQNATLQFNFRGKYGRCVVASGAFVP